MMEYQVQFYAVFSIRRVLRPRHDVLGQAALGKTDGGARDFPGRADSYALLVENSPTLGAAEAHSLLQGPPGRVRTGPPGPSYHAPVHRVGPDGNELAESCVLGLPQCSEDNPCPLHPAWKEIRRRLVSMLEE